MKQEDKELLLRYLSMALPYGVKIKIRSKDIRTVRTINIEEGLVTFFETDTISPFGLQIVSPLTLRQYVKPFLRPLASMTEEERTEINALIKQNSPSPCGKINLQGMDNLLYSVVVSSGFLIDWMLNKHFDIFDLIPKELAIAVTKENNPYDTAR